MYFDVLTTAAMADELNATLTGGRVQDVVLVDPLSLGLEVYAGHERRYLLLSAQAGHPRVHLLHERPRRGPDTPVPILLLLRKYVRGARLARVAQPGFERILALEFQTEGGLLTLLAEIMGRRSNIILLASDGTVMEAIKRVTPEQSRRPVLPRQPYIPPPPLEKPGAASLTPGRLAALLAKAEGPLWRRLVESVAGMSPLLAREVVFRSAGDAAAGEAAPADLLAVSRSLLVDLPESHGWHPTVGLAGGQVMAYAPYELTHLDGYQAMPTVSAAIEAFVAAQGALDPYGTARARVAQALSAARERELRRRAAIERDLRSEQELNALREAGEWILAYATQIAPRQEVLEVEGLDGKPLRIALEKERSPVENAQRYFKEYEKAKAAAQEGPRRLAEVDRALARLAQLESDLQLAENRAEIDQVRAELAEGGYVRSRRRLPGGKPAGPRRFETPEGFVIWVGRSSRQNAMVLERAAPTDLWFHARGVPGGHVILVTGGRPVPEELVQRVAALTAYYSAARGESRVPVDVTERRHVRPIPKAGPGQVTYRGERTLSVAPAGWAG